MKHFIASLLTLLTINCFASVEVDLSNIKVLQPINGPKVTGQNYTLSWDNGSVQGTVIPNFPHPHRFVHFVGTFSWQNHVKTKSVAIVSEIDGICNWAFLQAAFHNWTGKIIISGDLTLDFSSAICNPPDENDPFCDFNLISKGLTCSYAADTSQQTGPDIPPPS